MTRLLTEPRQGTRRRRRSRAEPALPFRATATLTVGADGRGSTVAQAVDAKFQRRGSASGAIIYGYFPGLARDRYHWAYRPGATAGVVPTGDGLACVWAGTTDRAVRRLGPKISRPPSGRCWPRRRREVAQIDRRRIARRSGPRLPRGARLSSDPAAARAGRWSATPRTTRTRSPRTASPTPCATRSSSPARCSMHHTADEPSSTPCRTTNTAATGSPEPLFDITERIASYQWDLTELRGAPSRAEQCDAARGRRTTRNSTAPDRSRSLLAG